MPVWIRKAMYFGNGGAALLFAIGSIAILTQGKVIASVIMAVLTALALMNIYVIGKAARLLSDVAWWESRVRVLELRQRAADLEEELQSSTQPLEPAVAAVPPPDAAKAE